MKRTPAPAKTIRCAIYTRKSTEEGLDQAFNSLHAQREACEAYVKSQAQEGWRTLPRLYDDGGFSGGNMERPALQALLADIDAGRIDTVVVYKVDRLTRALADFAKIVERLDAAGVSFVSVTQAFNTTTSMGRLTLNVLLSFAQFEREVTGERIRDKIAASKAKGMWMGGRLPLGYDAPTDPVTRALLVNPAEAEQVRLIFQTYLELGSVHALERFLDERGIRSKYTVTRQGRTMGGERINRGALFHLLKNRTYLGEIPHGDRSYPASHPGIIEPELFHKVQALLASHARAHHERPTRVATMPLKGLIFDADGQPMSPSFGHGQAGKVYRYYVSAPLQQGRRIVQGPDALRRISADAVERLVRDQLAARLQRSEETPLSEMIHAVQRVEIGANAVTITLKAAQLPRTSLAELTPDANNPALVVLNLPIRCQQRGGRTWLLPPHGSSSQGQARRDPALIRALIRAHKVAAGMGWRAADGRLDALQIKAPDNFYDRLVCRLVFLAPDLQQAILEGRQPVALNLERLIHQPIPMSWSAQRRLLSA